MTLAFRPFGIVVGILAGVIGSKVFERLWALIDDEDAPEPKHREIAFGKLVLALVLQGAIFRLLRGLADHGTRHAFARVTGEWPGQERPATGDD
jgi:Protein of unknown function (DUF4235)